MANFSLDTAKLMIDFCIQAYNEPAEIDVAPLGFQLVRTFYDKDSDTEAFIAKDEGRMVVAFRGTESKEDILTDLKIKKVKYPRMKRPIFKSRTHKGFTEAYKSIDDEVLASVKQLLDEGSYVVYFTGHSLGGALATLGAMHMYRRLKIPVILYTFGAPRVGNRWFKRYFNRKMDNVFRIVNDEDIIPSIPNKIFGYHHVERLALIDEHKVIYVNPSKDKVKEKEIEGWTSVLTEGLEEHGSDTYKKLMTEITDVLDVGVTGHR
ncbi:MAG: lipase family protein [Candidatus Kariarchaeaceae archaeon]|jgi:triacylglycerol lipase